MTERAAPFYCPYCGEEDIRPQGEHHGDWRCGGCLRVWTLRYVGLSAGFARNDNDTNDERHGDVEQGAVRTDEQQNDADAAQRDAAAGNTARRATRGTVPNVEVTL